MTECAFDGRENFVSTATCSLCDQLCMLQKWMLSSLWTHWQDHAYSGGVCARTGSRWPWEETQDWGAWGRKIIQF